MKISNRKYFSVVKVIMFIVKFPEEQLCTTLAVFDFDVMYKVTHECLVLVRIAVVAQYIFDI